ncbi:hypothetical protein BX600DRAFT_519302 [Xylariales sp. PMI_506]|nr:hypothetical protein BX600DRAFT_519302 [Xylariales sp. PMI_506]
MPVIIKPESHGANPVRHWRDPCKTAKELLAVALPNGIPNNIDVYQSSWGHGPDARLDQPIIGTTNGLVNALVHAYGQHHHLVIRPEDVWFAILTQFSLYVNAHAEEMRHHFVAHEGKVELRVMYDPYDRHTFDFRQFTQDILHLLHRSVTDADLRDWIMPDFSTTNDNDKIVASIVMMGTLQKYFDYTCGQICGFPTVELLGDKSDYEEILKRVDKLEQYGPEPTKFASLLRPVLRRFIRSFDDPKARDVIHFWKTVFDKDDSLCGTSWYTGWITAFCLWDEDGRYLYNEVKGPGDRYANSSKVPEVRNLVLDGVRYHGFDGTTVPPAWTRVPVKLEQYDVPDGFIMADMHAGLMGIGLSSSSHLPDPTLWDHLTKMVQQVVGGTSNHEPDKDENINTTDNTALNTMAPVAAWWITEEMAPKREAQQKEDEEMWRQERERIQAKYSKHKEDKALS